MRLIGFGAAIAAVLCANAAVGREADLLDFSRVPDVASQQSGEVSQDVGPRLDGLGSNPFSQSGAVEGSVVDTMRADFIQRGYRETQPSEFRLPVPDVSIEPTFKVRGGGAANFAMPGLPSGFVAGPASGSFSYCDGATYAPTWWLHRSVEQRRALYFDTVASIACEYGIPTSLLDAVIAQESGYKFWAVSHAGAMGMMQIMPGTARLLGLALPFDALANMRAGARYLKQQLDRFGRVDLALAAYNAGPDRKSLRAGYIPRIPETINYVSTITTNWARLSDPGVQVATNVDRGAIAAAAVRASGYRSVELVRYDGLNAAKPI